jgi:ABC-type nitrate/sulfonate/bicarbonate transport system permease component
MSLEKNKNSQIQNWIDNFLPALVLLGLYIILFEFVLPVNKILPKPSLLWESLIAIWADYNLLEELSVSTMVIYGGMIISYTILYIFRVPLIKLITVFNPGLQKLSFLKYFPAFFYAVLFAFWFPNSLWAEFGFVFLAIIFYMLLQISNNLESTSNNFILTAKNLNCSENKIIGDVVWKSVLPKIFEGMIKIHFVIWILVLLYEFVGDYFGLGHVYNTALQYNDFAGLFSIAIYVALLIKLGSMAISFTKSKLIYWE